MGVILKPSEECNRRALIIEGLHTGRSATEIIRFFRYLRPFMILCYDIVCKIYGFRTVQRTFQYVSEKGLLERTHREDPSH